MSTTSFRRSATWLLGLGLAFTLGCKSKRTGGTPNDTVLIDWTPSMSERASFTKAVVGAKTTKEYPLRWTLEGDAGTLRIAARVDTGSAEIEEEGKKTVQAPVALSLKLVDNGVGAKLETKCHGPNWQMPSKGTDGQLTTSPVMLMDCTINAKYDDSNQILHLTIWGDGRFETDHAKIENQ